MFDCLDDAGRKFLGRGSIIMGEITVGSGTSEGES